MGWYIFDPCRFFSWLARLLLSSLARLAEGKKTTQGLLPEEPPPDCRRERREQDLTIPTERLKCSFNTMHATLAKNDVGQRCLLQQSPDQVGFKA